MTSPTIFFDNGNQVVLPAPNGVDTIYEFKVDRAGDLSQVTTVNWNVWLAGYNGHATLSDFPNGVAPSGQLSFLPGQSSQIIDVIVHPTATNNFRGNKYFSINLNSPNATVNYVSNGGVGFIYNGLDNPGTNINNALSIASNVQIRSSILQPLEANYYKLSFIAGHTYNFIMWSEDYGKGSTLNLLPELSLLNSSFSVISDTSVPAPNVFSSSSGQMVGVTYTAVNTGSYYLKAQPSTNATNSVGDYGIQVFDATIADGYSGFNSTIGSISLLRSNIGAKVINLNAGVTDYFKVYLKQGTQYDFNDFSIGNISTKISLVDAGNHLQSIAGANSSASSNNFSYTPNQSGYYYLVVDGVSGSGPIAVNAEQHTYSDAYLSSSVNTIAVTARSGAVQASPNSSTNPYLFEVTRDGLTNHAVRLNWHIEAPTDLLASFGGSAPSGVLDFAIGQSQQTISVNISPDSSLTQAEQFILKIDTVDPTASISMGYDNVLGEIIPSGHIAVSYSTSINSIDSIGLPPDGQHLLIKVDGATQSVAVGSTIAFSSGKVTTVDLTNTIAPTPVFKSSGGINGYALPDKYSGDASLHLQYQLIETADNAVVIGGSSNDFIKVASTNSTGKAVDGGGGSDVIDGGVGSTFVTGGTSHSGSTFFLDGRAPGVSWSTITDFKTGSDQATIWGFVKGVSSVDTSFTDPNHEGAGGIYSGLTLHFKNLLPDGQATGTNTELNSITLSGHTLADIGVSSLQDLNNQISHVTTANQYGQFIINDHLIIGQTNDAQGTHGYLFVH